MRAPIARNFVDDPKRRQHMSWWNRTRMAHKDRPLITGPDSPAPPFPIYLTGPVIKGFGRGSKDLGIPTGISPTNVPTQR